jgi:hypothetical protein
MPANSSELKFAGAAPVDLMNYDFNGDGNLVCATD